MRQVIKTLMSSIISIVLVPIASASQKVIISTEDIGISKICDAIVTEAFKTINIDFESMYLPGKRTSYMSNRGGTDGEMCRIRGFDDTYTNLIRIEPSIISFEASVFTKDRMLKVERDGWDYLRPFLIGIHTGHYYSTNGTKGFPYVDSSANDLLLIRKLDAGIIDVAIMVTSDGMYALKQAQNENLLRQGKTKILQFPIAKHALYLYIHKKNKYLIPRITKAISKIVKSGRATAIYNEMSGEQQKSNTTSITSLLSPENH
jgi:hypothetical protein